MHGTYLGLKRLFIRLHPDNINRDSGTEIQDPFDTHNQTTQYSLGTKGTISSLNDKDQSLPTMVLLILTQPVDTIT